MCIRDSLTRDDGITGPSALPDDPVVDAEAASDAAAPREKSSDDVMDDDEPGDSAEDEES